MINPDFVPYNESLKLKELGFDEPCFGFYHEICEDNNKVNCSGEFQNMCGWVVGRENTNDLSSHDFIIVTPLYQQGFRWFRLNHNWQHSILPTSDQHSHKLGYNYWIWNNKTGEEYETEPKDRPKGDFIYESYEEAELECLRKLIELTEKNK